MNEKKAKRVRKLVYGDGSKRNENRYKWVDTHIMCVGKRATYLKAKKRGD
jgi:hypothetical protein